MGQYISVFDLSKRYKRVEPFRSKTPYPLYQNYKESYNFDNVLECVDKWTTYSEDINKSLHKVLELFDMVASKGKDKQLDIITGKINENIIFSIKEPVLLRTTISQKIKESEGYKRNCLESILDRINESVHCDRVLKNHNMFSKRFNISSYMRKNAYEDNTKDTIYEVCSFIDTYKMGINSKYSIALEEVLFLCDRFNIPITPNEITETVTDYFLSNHLHQDDSSRELLHVLESTVALNRFFTNEDIKYLHELKTLTETTITEETLDNILESSLKDKTKEMIAKFKMLPSKSPEALKQLLINILVVNKDENIVDGSKNLLSIAFYFFVIVGALSLSVYAGIFAAVVAKTINMITERKYMTDVLKVWYHNRDSAAKKAEACKDPEKKKRLEAYVNQMDKSIESLENYSDSLRGDDEKKSWETRPSNYSKKDDGDFDLDFNFDECAKQSAIDIAIIEAKVSSLSWDKSLVEQTIFATDIIPNIKLEDIDYLADFCTKYPDMIDREKFIEALVYADKVAVKESIMDNCNKINCYSKNIKLLLKESCKKEDYDFDDEDDIFSDLDGLLEYTNNINSYVTSIQELGLTSSLKLVSDKLTGIASNLSDKEKLMSKTVDDTCARLSRSVEKALTVENREAVIRGDVLPSASKVIKLAITTGIAFLIHPALAVIMVLGRFAINSKLRAKERQMVLDELDVELTMVDKYIQQAEDKKDMKRLRELYMIKKKLQAQDARLRYKIKIEWNDKNVKPLGEKERDED